MTNYTTQTFLDGKVTLYGGDNRDVLRGLPDNSIDSIVTDPPYALVSIVKRFGGANAKPANDNDVYSRASRGFMGKQWDTGEVAFSEVFWAECLRVLKPGGHVAAFSGTRTYHRMACAIEDAGFEIRDQLAWAYGSGFPKSHDVSKAIDKAAGAEREVIRERYTVKRIKPGATVEREGAWGKQDVPYTATDTAPATVDAYEWQGWGTALKPSWEPICLGRKPLIGTVAENVLEHGTGALNIDGCRVGDEDTRSIKRGGRNDFPNEDDTWEPRDVEVGSSKGRWPANIVHDGSDEVVAAFPAVGNSHPPANAGTARNNMILGSDNNPRAFHPGFADSGSAARFFYTAKADKEDRMGSKHPTVKPVDLMQWLCRLITPPGGTVLDPFAGSGSTGEAAWREGFSAVLCEREEEYQSDIAARLRLASAGPMERKARAIKQVTAAGPLFGDNDNNPAGGGGGRQIYGRFADQSPDYRTNRAQVVKR